MGRFNSSGSKSHGVQRIGQDHYRLSWTVDRYTKNSRLRHPTRYARDSDEAGARRFIKKWDVVERRIPTELTTPDLQ